MVLTQAIVSREPTEPFQPNWSLEKVHVGAVGDEDVLVEMHAAGICHTDFTLTSLPSGALGTAYPKIAGHEGAGVVQAVGSNVQGIEIGDPVLLSFRYCSACPQCEAAHPAHCDRFAVDNCVGNANSTTAGENDEPIWTQFFGQSSFAGHSVVNKSCVVNAKGLVENHDELKLFASLGCGFQTGMGAVQNIAQVGPEDVVMITGMGAVGMGALLTAKIAGCKSILAVDRIQSRLDMALRVGASHVINTSKASFVKLDDAVREIFPRGVSVVIDTSGVSSLIEEGIEATCARSRVVLVGMTRPEYKLEVNVLDHLQKGRSIMGCVEGDCVPQKAVPQMIQWYREGKFPLDLFLQYFNAADYEQAVSDLKKGEAIKTVLVWK